MSSEVTIYPQAGQYWFLFFTCHVLGEENTVKGLNQRGLKYTEKKPLGRLCKMFNPFFHESFLQENGFQFVCYAATLFSTETAD